MIKSINDLTLEDVAGICDHTYLNRPEAFYGKVKNPVKAWNEEFNDFLKKTANLPFAPYGTCTRHETIKDVKKFFDGKNIKTIATAGFPYGPCPFDVKKDEALIALRAGADEVDVVMNYLEFKNGNINEVYREFYKLNKIIQNHNALSKIILETSELNSKQVKLACRIANDAGFDFVKTSSGYTDKFAEEENLRIMREYFPRGVKMAGKVDKDNYKSLLRAASGRDDNMIDLDPMRIRIGESKLISSLMGESGSGY